MGEQGMRNKKIYAIVNCIFVFVNTASCVPETIFRYSDEKITWFEAQKKCQDINGNLLVPSVSNVDRLQKLCIDGVTGNVWSGHYYALSDWMEFVGCYTKLNRPKVQGKSLTTSDPLVCQHLCQNNTYFGFYKGDICICFGDDDYVLGNNLQADAQQCHIRCAERPTVFCGGNAAVSVYKTVLRRFNDKPEYDCTVEDCNCIAAECKYVEGALKKDFYKQPCSTDLATVCSNNVLTAGESPHWTDSLTRCTSQANRYPIGSEADVEFCEKSTSTWTSIFRDVFLAEDELGIALGNVKYCSYINWTGTKVAPKQGNCSEKMVFVCEIATDKQKNHDHCQEIRAAPLEQSGGLASEAVVGIVLPLVIVPAIVFTCIILLYRWRRSSKDFSPKKKEETNENSDPSDKMKVKQVICNTNMEKEETGEEKVATIVLSAKMTEEGETTESPDKTKEKENHLSAKDLDVSGNFDKSKNIVNGLATSETTRL